MVTQGQILDALEEVFDDSGQFNAILMFKEFHALGVRDIDKYIEGLPREYARNRLQACAAAIFYFVGDIRKAVDAIDADNYRWFDVEYSSELGEAAVEEACHNCKIFNGLPEIVETYLDYQQIGEDLANGEDGEFTPFGYFAPAR